MPEQDHRHPDTLDDSHGNDSPGDAPNPQPHQPADGHSTRGVGDDARPAEDGDDDAARRTAVPPFVWTIPDFVRADPRKTMPPTASRLKPGGQTIATGLRWLVHAAVIAQGRARVFLPDVVFYQVVWGGDARAWPANRRQDILAILRDRGPVWGIRSVEHLEAKGTAAADSASGNGVEEKSNPDAARQKGHACRPGCLLHGSGLRHHHFVITVRTIRSDATDLPPNTEEAGDDLAETFLGSLEVFGEGDEESRTYQWNPPRPPKPTKDTSAEDAATLETERRRHTRVQSLQRAGMTPAVYFPMLVFGSSPRVGLSVRQRLLHRAIVRELTRVPRGRKSDRPDRADVIIGGQVSTGKGGASVYPDLPAGVRYVGFNGNGFGKQKKLCGRGYSLRSWMERAKYPTSGSNAEFWTTARRFLDDLGALAGTFGLTVATWHPQRREWQPLEALFRSCRSADGRQWLKDARLRVYTRDDYVDRWRAWLAARMGFSVIPRPGDEPSPESGPHTSAAALRAVLSSGGVSQAAFAKVVGASGSEVSKRLNGSLPWHSKWADRVKKALVEHPEWERGVSKNSD